MEILDFVKEQLVLSQKNWLSAYPEVKSFSVEFSDESPLIFMADRTTLEFSFDNAKLFVDGELEKTGLGMRFTCAHKTPKGYISDKSINVTILNKHEMTINEATEVLKYNTDAVHNSFDPFWHENQDKRRNSIGWNGVIQYLQDDCR